MPATALETTKIAEAGPSNLSDCFRTFKAGGGTITTMTNTQLKESGPGFWADMARQGGQVLSP